jgi:aldehyde dehydrogenase (NAD+)
MAANDFPALIARHRNCFLRKTCPVEWREAQLDALVCADDRARDAEFFFDALWWKDLRRNRVDADATDVKHVADEAAYARPPSAALVHPP